jgi:hypothetical protein
VVIGGLEGHAIQVLHGTVDDELPRGDGARQRADGIMYVEDQRVRQFADVVQPAFGARAAPARLAVRCRVTNFRVRYQALSPGR